MTTNTTQSAATSACSEARRVHPHKPSPFFPFWDGAGSCGLPFCFTRVAARRARAADFLIANARLEFNVSHSKENLLKISNRERIAVFHPRFHPRTQKGRGATSCPPKVQPRVHPLYSSFQPRASSLQYLIANPELESRLTYRKLSPLKSLIANILRLFISISLSACSLAPLKGDSFLQAPSSRNTHENTCRAQDPRRASRSAEPFGLPRPVQASQPRPAE